MNDLPRPVDRILPSSSELIDQLLAHTPQAIVTSGMDLSDPKIQISLAEAAARRGLVEQLDTFRKRGKESSNGR